MDENYNAGWRFAGRNTPATPEPDQVPVVPLPPLVPDSGSGDIGQIPDNSLPIPPEGPPAANPDANMPMIPLPPIVGTPDIGPYPPQYPAAPGPGFVPNFGVGGGIILLPGLINPRYATVRFLNAAPDYDALRITVGNQVAAPGLTFGSLTGYGRVGDGFRTVTIARARAPREIIYRQNLPFTAGELVTLAVVRTNIGLDLVRISDMPCRNWPTERACIRCVNLCWDAPPLDVLLSDGRLVFSDVRYKEVTNFRQAWPRDYSFYIAQTSYMPAPYFSDIETIEDTPLVVPSQYLPGVGGPAPLASFYISAKRNGVYTVYMLGNWNNQRPDLRVRVVEDFQ